MTPTLEDAQRQSEVQRARAERLEAEVAVLEGRLVELEQARAADAGDAARVREELESLRKEQALIAARATKPLRRLEQGLRWLAEKAGKVAGILARHLLFRRRGDG